MFAVTVVVQQPPTPRAAVVRGDSGTVAVWSEGDSTWIYIVSPRASAAIPVDAATLPRVADSAARAAGVSPDSAKVLRNPSPLGDTLASTYFDYQVEHQAKELPKTPEPRYPDQLRTDRCVGQVIAQFIIDSAGNPVLASFKALKSPQRLFTLAIYSALAHLHFEPAQVKGHPVAELVQMQFEFGPRTATISVGAPDASATVAFSHDTARLTLTTARGTFIVHADSFTMAAWADSAAHGRAPKPHGATKSDYSESVLSYPEGSVNTTVAMGILRLTADSASPYQVTGANGSWSGALIFPYDSAQRLFAAMRGSPSVMSVWDEGFPLMDRKRTYASDRTARQVAPVPGNREPAYPTKLVAQRVEGTVLVQFMVDTTGAVEMSSIRILKSSNPLFALSVYLALPRMRFYPAMLDGKKVRELVQQPYAFNFPR